MATMIAPRFRESAVDLSEKPLRDLSQAEFHSLYGTDRFTAATLASRMRYVVKHMSTRLMTSAFSMILRDWYDFAVTISGPPEMNYPMSTGSDSLLNFMFTMPEGVRNTIEEIGVENVRQGDVIICNDPYRVGLHVNDVAFIRPVFSNGRLTSFVAIRAHQLDMGGAVPGGFSGTKKNVQETGLVIPPMFLYRDDKPIASTFNLIFDNARFAPLLLPDMKSLYQCLLLGERLLHESIARYGFDAYLGAIRYACDVSADAMRHAIATKIPDGVYYGEDMLDSDGLSEGREYRVRAKITKVGHRLELDFSGSSPEAPASINCGPLDVKAGVGVALKMLIEQETPLSSGVFRDIDIVLPPGTFVSATPTGPVFMYWEPQFCVLSAVYKAFSQALGDEAIGLDFGSMMVHNGSGVRKDGTPWLSVATCGGEHGPWGATKVGDGDSYTVNHTGNNLDPAIEAIESEIPGVFMRKEYAIDTGGPGKFRGGAAVIRDTYWLEPGSHGQTTLHTKSPAGVGANGGRSGTSQACWTFPPESFDVAKEQRPLPIDDANVYRGSEPMAGVLDPETKALDPAGKYFYFASRAVWELEPGSSMRFQTAGGGGWGDPLERDPERVKRDVRDEYVSIKGALRDYGVVITGEPKIHPERLEIDQAATERHRAAIRAAARPR